MLRQEQMQSNPPSLRRAIAELEADYPYAESPDSLNPI